MLKTQAETSFYLVVTLHSIQYACRQLHCTRGRSIVQIRRVETGRAKERSIRICFCSCISVETGSKRKGTDKYFDTLVLICWRLITAERNARWKKVKKWKNRSKTSGKSRKKHFYNTKIKRQRIESTTATQASCIGCCAETLKLHSSIVFALKRLYFNELSIEFWLEIQNFVFFLSVNFSVWKKKCKKKRVKFP